MTTPEAYGMVRPTGTDLISEGDNAISQNATATATALDALWAPVNAQGTRIDTLEPAVSTLQADKVKRPPLTAAQDLNDLNQTGIYPVTLTPTDWVAQHYPFNGKGEVTHVQQNASSFTQFWAGGSVDSPKFFIRYKQDNVLGNWIEVTGWQAGDTSNLTAAKAYTDTKNLIKPFVGAAVDLDTLKTDGDYPLIASVTDWAAQHYPANVKGHLMVRAAGSWAFQLLRSHALTTPQMWIRTYVGSWSAWFEVTYRPTLKITEGIGQGGISHEMLVDDLLDYYNGPIGTSGAAPVCLTFDDYPRDFRDHMRAELTARNIPYTLAMCSGQYDSNATAAGGTWASVYDGAAGTTWAEIDGWLDADYAEAANHSRRHAGGSGVDWLTAEIITGKAELEAALPSKPIWGWIQPSATYADGDGNPVTFNNGDSIAAYSKTLAGKYIWDNHAIITGVRTPNGLNRVARRGRPVQGLTRSWISSTPGITGTKASIQACTANKQGIILGSHANDIPNGHITATEFTDFLDWLITEQTAGRIRLMTLSEWAIADTSLPA